LGLCYDIEENWKRAINAYKRSLRFGKIYDHEATYNNLHFCYKEIGEKEKAKEAKKMSLAAKEESNKHMERWRMRSKANKK